MVGTTGWTDKIKEIRKSVDDAGIGFIHAPNFSIGVNIFYEIVKNASKIFNNLEEYDIFCVGSPYYDLENRSHFTVFRITEDRLYAHDAAASSSTGGADPHFTGWEFSKDIE